MSSSFPGWIMLGIGKKKSRVRLRVLSLCLTLGVRSIPIRESASAKVLLSQW